MRFLLIAAVLLFPTLCYPDDAHRIEEIKKIFAEWQPILRDVSNKRFIVYRYVSGENYKDVEWSAKELNSEEKTLSDQFTILRKDMGTYVQHEQPSFSGDWHIVSEHYYDKRGKLLFVFWKMNTFQADEPATIEKRLYFSENGKIIKSLKDIYKMNTKQKIDIGFMEYEVNYTTDFKATEYYKYLPRHP